MCLRMLEFGIFHILYPFQLIEQKLSSGNNNLDGGPKNIFIDLAIDLMRRGEFSWQNVEDESNVIVFGVS